jgi:hypothetical protein
MVLVGYTINLIPEGLTALDVAAKERARGWARLYSAERRKIDMATSPEACLAGERANWKEWMEVIKNTRQSRNKCRVICNDIM